MAGRIRHYFAGGNTAQGFFSLFDSSLQGLDRLFILKGGPGTGKSTLMKKVAQAWGDRGFDIEILHCSSDNGSIDGVIIPKLKAGIVDGTAPHVIEPKAPGAVEEYVNLGVAWHSRKLARDKTQIIQLSEQISEAFQSAYSAFAQALKVHDEWEKIYIDNIDFAKVNQLAETMIASLLGEKRLNKKPDVRHRFLGAATPDGPVDFIENLTEALPNRYFLKGRPGTGKSTMLKKIAAAAANRGFDVEIYHCGFDPDSLDMVVVRELGFTVFDSTAPHEYFPSREGDEIVDLYERAVVPGTDERYAQELEDIKQKYSLNMKEGTSYLAKTKALHDELESFYIQAMDFTKIDQIRDEINAEIGRIAQADSHAKSFN